MDVQFLETILSIVRKYVDFMKGGISKGDYKGIDEDALREGIDIEMEHTADKDIARKIASDHLKEHSDYYKRLKEAGL